MNRNQRYSENYKFAVENSIHPSTDTNSYFTVQNLGQSNSTTFERKFPMKVLLFRSLFHVSHPPFTIFILTKIIRISFLKPYITTALKITRNEMLQNDKNVKVYF